MQQAEAQQVEHMRQQAGQAVWHRCHMQQLIAQACQSSDMLCCRVDSLQPTQLNVAGYIGYMAIAVSLACTSRTSGSMSQYH